MLAASAWAIQMKASTTTLQHPAARFSGITTSADRSQAFRKARRHSAIVRGLKLGLPLASVLVAALYVLPSQFTYTIKDGEASVEAIDLSSGALKMVNPRIRGVHAKQGVYDIRADSGTQAASEPEVMTFDRINAEILSSQGEKTTLTAPTGIYHSKKEELVFNTGVTIGGDGGMSGTLKTAKAYMKENRLVSDDPVALAYHGHTITADSVTVHSDESRVVFTGNVKVHLERAQKEGTQ